ncbi:glucosidase [Oscillatoria sp. FACHB-1406]|uniref:MGH1-like glycoside hydrolase domain-containing protein n=1 Tax=Oscillatoria sp. FACHB-1406 TaxID=2692846 RepID=UPI0016850294|nr:glucosidase [Oscillatoria sp. FACHB-1406]MBD2578376.1 glucosidase [Oscillatoria sp. FACHB-1406]
MTQDQKSQVAIQATAEGKRLAEDREKKQSWKRWGPYLSDRQWGTVREDYSDNGTAWEYFSHDQARSRAYRWGEDGIAGISDDTQNICFAIALWNEKDAILKERLFGLTGNEGNHGEDVKEYYFYTDSTPTHSYMKCLYKYPQKAFPYEDLLEENRKRKSNTAAFEYELLDTGVFKENRYFDVAIEYAKNDPEDILIQISASNRGPEAAKLHLLPTLWFKNTWALGYPNHKREERSLKTLQSSPDLSVVEVLCPEKELKLAPRRLYCEAPQELLYTENETNLERFGWGKNTSYVKDGINDYIVSRGEKKTVNPEGTGTKVSAHYDLTIPAGETVTIRLRLSTSELSSPFAEFNNIVQQRRQEMDEFYDAVCPHNLSDDMRSVQRQAFAGMLWSKQFYHYVVYDWLSGDPRPPKPPQVRKQGRNHEWNHLFCEDIISMPDKWEYPWFAAWDLAFHTIPFALIDPDFAKKQLYLFTREWYLHPNGQMAAYEWNFGDVNPPVHAWAAWRVYKIEKKMYGRADTNFLEEVFQKLSLYFTWWVNRKDANGKNIFQGGFLGLDNIGAIDRSNINTPGVSIEQSDGTSWMAMFCLNMMKIATELAKRDKDLTQVYQQLRQKYEQVVLEQKDEELIETYQTLMRISGKSNYEDMASKFFQHFLLIADAMNKIGGEDQVDIWDEDDNFYYDILNAPEGRVSDGVNTGGALSMKVRSMVGLIPLFAVETIDPTVVNDYLSSDFKERMMWFVNNRPQLTKHNNIELVTTKGKGLYLSLVNKERLKYILQRMLDRNEFLSDYGIRALSKYHEEHPYTLWVDGNKNEVKYAPGESITTMFGGNSNWRGPIWMPVNFLIIESLQKFYYYWGDEIKVNCPNEKGEMQEMNLWEVSMELSRRVINIFLKQNRPNPFNSDLKDWRPVYGGTAEFQSDPHWRDLILFYEYFHGDNGAGVGASHQTGWTGVVAKLIQQYGQYTLSKQAPER